MIVSKISGFSELHLDKILFSNSLISFKSILSKCNSDNPEILEAIKKSGKLEEETEKSLIKLIEELKKSFKS